jgi:peptidoglycan hydrolase-like protein with peptidoglycan-binding domain
MLASSYKENVMIKIPVAALLAISSVAAVSACSSYGDSQPSRVSYASPQPPALSQDMIVQVQSRLQQAGKYHGRIDGQWGPATEAAVRSYQQQHNLNPTGQLDGNTLAALNWGDTRQTYGSAQPNGYVQPNGERYGSPDAPPINTNTPYSSATQLNPSPAR